MASRTRQIIFGVIAATAMATAINMAMRTSPEQAWCTYKRDKDALTVEANKNPAFTPEGGGNWMDVRAAWIEPRIADLQVRHFGDAAQARQMQAEWASKADCRK